MGQRFFQQGRYQTAMTFGLAFCWVLSFLTGIANAAEGEKLVDRLIAHIDGKPVLMSEVLRKVDKGPLVAVSEYPAQSTDKDFDRALQDSLNVELIMARSKELGVSVTDDDLEKEITRFLGERQVTREKLLDTLQAEGQSYEDYRADFRTQMVLSQFKGRVILPLIKITEKDVQNYYQSTMGALPTAAEVVLRQIFIRVSEGTPKEIRDQKQAVIQELTKRLAGGLSFEDAMKIYTDDPDGRTGDGLIQGLRVRDLAPTIRASIENLKPGEVSQPVSMPDGFRIYQLVERKIAGDSEYESKKQQLQYQLQMQELANQTKRWLARERQRASIKILTI